MFATPTMIYVDWLRDAHAMAEHGLVLLADLAQRPDHPPHWADRLVDHLAETKDQRATLRHLIEAQDADVSVVKDMLARSTATGQVLGRHFGTADLEKAVVALYAFEHQEQATYRLLLALAQHRADASAATAFQRAIAQHQAMADWLDQHFTDILGPFLARTGAGHEPPG